MRMLFALALASLTTATTACATSSSDDQSGVDDQVLDPENGTVTDLRITSKDLVEPVFVNGSKCKLVFPGGLTSSTEYYQVWPVGTNGIVEGAKYNTPLRPNLYAVFGVTIPADSVHHIDGYSQFDHYHVVDNVLGTIVLNTKWDLLTFWPGPNYNPATYKIAKSVKDLMAQSAAGILSPVTTLPEVGFPEVVLYAPVTCR